MKILDERARPQRILSGEVIFPLGNDEPAYDFMQHVQPSVWSDVAVDQALQEVLANRASKLEVLTNLARLAEVNAALGKRLRENASVVERIKRKVNIIWNISILQGADTGINEIDLKLVGTFVSLLPELRSELPKPTNEQFEKLLEQALIFCLKKSSFDVGSEPIINLMQIFPELQPQIRQAIDDPTFKKSFSDIIDRERAEAPRYYQALARAAVLYPNEFTRYKKMAQPYAKEALGLLARLRGPGTQTADLAWSVAVLNATHAEIDQTGKLELGKRQIISKSRPLSDRPMVSG